jgi:periplasmic copper chaperone A
MRAALLPVLAFAILVGCDQAPETIFVTDASVRLPAASGRPGAAYFTLNGGPTEDRLLSVSTPLAVRAEMHDMTMAGGVMRMAPLEGGVALPAGGKVVFESGGKHVMLYDISPKAQAGATMPIQFRFASGAILDAEAKIVAAGGEGADHR